jgi:hypothetical protein
MQFSPNVHHARMRILRASRPLALALFTLAAPVACHRGSTGAAQSKVALTVTNRGFFDVNVFVIRSPIAQPIRLGTVTGGLDKTFDVAETDLQAGQNMVVQVRTIAGQTAWTSQSVNVNLGSTARLDVVTTSSGDLSQSRLYVQAP